MYGAPAMEPPLPELTLAATLAGEDPRRMIILEMLAEEAASIPELIRRWPREAPTMPKIHYQVGHLVEARCIAASTGAGSRGTREPIYSVTSMGKALLASFDAS
ncbi:MAG: hypothetical protein JST59_29450 [Actinobacteria bacterium]|nr:hypothetical protein [Actinomycetota bacterium]